ncbi:MAG: extracellular solute-binding protein [Azospirillum sp.]|nr:extracellular solute-binding protein [Azospirillum sp.]
MTVLRVLIGAALGLAALTVEATAGRYLDWFDDGTVLLKLGPGYDNAVLETTRDELGRRFGPDLKPFDGLTIRLLSHDEGDKGPISGPIEALRPVWEELTGARLEVTGVPVTELYPRMMLDLRQGTRLYDSLIVAAFYYGELIAGHYIAPIDDLIASGDFPRWHYQSMPLALRQLHQWGGVGYGVRNDADGQVLYYRRDVLNDPAWQTKFKQTLGHDLPVPPRTWQKLLEVSTFFNERNWDSHDPYPDSGTVLALKQGEQGHFHFQSLSASFAIGPEPAQGASPARYWFDPTDMTPSINGPGQVAALDLLRRLNDTGPADQIGWRLGQAWDYFLRGKAVFAFSWGDLGALCEDPERSQIKGNCAVAVLPSSERYWDRVTGEWQTPTAPHLIGNTTGGSWHGVVTASSQHREAAYSFLALMAIKPVSLWNVEHGWTGINPGFHDQFLKPDGEASLIDYVKAGWDRRDVQDYLKAYHDTFTAPVMLPYLRIRGTPDYWAVLDRELGAALGGRKSSQRALDDTAAAWDRITDRLGRADQLKAYRAALGLPE